MNTLIIRNITDDQLRIALAWAGLGGHESTGTQPPAPITVDTRSLTPPSDPLPPASLADHGPDRPAGAWLRSEVNTLLRALELDGSRVQAEAIRLAMASAERTVSREEINAMRGSDGGMQGFVKPINRVTKDLIRRGQLHARARDPLLSALLINGTAAGYRISSQIVDDPIPPLGIP